MAHEAAAKDLGAAEVNAKVCRTLWTKVIPGILDQFDCPSMLRLFAGRPLLLLNGELDPNCPLEGAKLAFAAAQDAYQKAGCADRLRISGPVWAALDAASRWVAAPVPPAILDQLRRRSAATGWFRRWELNRLSAHASRLRWRIGCFRARSTRAKKRRSPGPPGRWGRR